ncbi:carboxymuconolactone decarboxylase family protein [Motilimonas eburnea]|uniref:carboxymuconolactone decarboxylase family protein n=1 Tax=Motilimonas eburnea TaxID=1737488 RepID=UPI001E33C9F9|nr:peroxidase-related enzyme [Motilimonas eburnea]MCE2571271.1 peroxidase-related enzyme [Motilimonas eburnea]
MSRINLVTPEQANPEQQALFAAIEQQLGVVPNFLKVLANSPAALKAFLGLHTIANEGSLTPQTKERIALGLAQQNACQYCVSAHTALGKSVGLSADEMAANREGGSSDSKAAVAVKFAQALAEKKGEVSSAELLALQNAGYSDAEVVEIITHVGMNVLTNILGKASRVEIDFPKIELHPVN